MTRYLAERAWLGGELVADDVAIDVDDGQIVAVRPDSASDAAHTDVVHLPGLTVPGLANAHSHAFHRAIRGISEAGPADFWQWREVMYRAAAALDPDRYYALARAVYAEMVLSGITVVGEFHYVHHDHDGRPYADANAMGEALIAAATDVGLRITLLDTCYLTADVSGSPLTGVQQRFDDGTWQSWAQRVGALTTSRTARIGAAIHSVRAVPADAMRGVAEYASEREWPLHFHLSEQPAENRDCVAATGRTPTALLHEVGALGPRSTAVHATHLTDDDITALGTTRTTLCMCPTTERFLADGIGPARQLVDAGSPMSLGTDGHMVIDLWEDMRGVELDERLATMQRGRHTAVELLTAATVGGWRSLGWDGGTIAVGAPADLTSVRLDTPRTAAAPGADPVAQVVFSATAADVSHVVVDGQVVVADGAHRSVPRVGAALSEAIAALHEQGA